PASSAAAAPRRSAMREAGALPTGARVRSRTARDLLYSVFARGVMLLGGFAVSVLLARLLGAEGRGVIAAVFLIPTLLLYVADLGVRQATAYFTGRQVYAYEDIVKTSAFMWLVTSAGATAAIAAYYAVFYVGKYELPLLAIALATMPFTLLVNYAKGILQGRDRVGKVNNLEMLNVGVNVAAVLVLLGLLKLGVLGAALVQLLMGLLVAVQALRMVRQIAGGVRIGYVKGLPTAFLKKGLTYAATLFVLQLNYRIDVLMLERMASVREVGLYTVGTTLAELIWQLPAAAGMVLFAKSAGSKSEGEATRRAAKLLRVMLPVLIAVCLGLGVFAPLAVDLLYGADFDGSAQVIRLLLPGIVVMTFFKILNADLAGRGKPLFALGAYILPLVLNVVLNLIFIPQYGIEGTALTSTISYTVGGLLFLYLYLRETGLRLTDVLILRPGDLRRK
ncbi:polysaccharide biosynthesis C-terminal domain-containing protein, partial [Paenibacillus sp. IB182496]